MKQLIDLHQVSASASAAPLARQRARGERRFELKMAIAFLLTALAGFGPSYYFRAASPAPALSRWVHVHALVFTAWLLLLLVQTAFIAAARVDLHRRLGVAGVGLALAMIPLGFITAVSAARAGVTATGKNPMDLLVFQLGAIVLFAAFVGAALVNRRRSETHRRLMLLATVCLIPPAIARLPFVGLRPVLALALSTLFVVAGVVHDLRARGRVHPVYVWGGTVILASGPLRFLLGQTSAWQAFARFLVG